MRGSRGGVARWARGGGATVGTVCACDACSETCMERVPGSLARCSACAAVVWCWATQNPYKAENGPEGGKTALEAAEVAGGCGGCGWGGVCGPCGHDGRIVGVLRAAGVFAISSRGFHPSWRIGGTPCFCHTIGEHATEPPDGKPIGVPPRAP